MKVSVNKGFTLIELLVVIAIIGLLSSVVLASVSSARNKSRIATAQANMETFGKILQFAQGESGKTLIKMSIDGGSTAFSNCSRCLPACGTNDLRNIPASNACSLEWSYDLAGVKMNAGNLGDNLALMQRDPWGSPYMLDQNQGESGLCNQVDTIRSNGPDGIWGTADDVFSLNPLPMGPVCP